MSASIILQILKVGLSGLVFLLCAMAFQLLRAEQRKVHLDPKMLKSINRYLWQGIFCAVLVGFFSLADAYLARQHRAQADSLEACGDSLQRLDTYSKLPNISSDDLRSVVAKHVSACGAIVNDSK